jgi:hypothetical protein
MIENVWIELDGTMHLCSYDPSVEPPEKSWTWQLSEKVITDASITKKLTLRYLREHASLAKHPDEPDRTRYYKILKSMWDIVEPTSPIKCRDCKRVTRDYYPDGRCAFSHEHFVGSSRVRNSWSGKGPGQTH